MVRETCRVVCIFLVYGKAVDELLVLSTIVTKYGLALAFDQKTDIKWFNHEKHPKKWSSTFV